jgi:probable F420-dependent oxidoreductase
MRFGINLPQIGRKAGPAAIRRAAEQAEALGFSDIWTNDHLAVPADAPYPPSKIFYEPVIALTWAAAATRKVGLGVSVLVLPLRHPVHLAKELATLDLLSEGRLILGAGTGWLEGEFEALGVPKAERGARTDESIEILRMCWERDPIDYDGRKVPTRMRAIRTLPQPGRRLPIWVGGISPPAIRRAIRLGDGWHGIRLSPEELAPLAKELRQARPTDFTLSLRLNWDPLVDDVEAFKRNLDAYRALGLDHMSFEPRQRELDGWLGAVEATWRLVEPHAG